MIDTVPLLAALQRVAGITRSGLHFELEDDCTQPRTCLESGKIYTRTPRFDWTQHQVTIWLGENYHEVGHHAPEVSDALKGMRFYNVGFDSRLGRLINILEDWRNEINGRGKYVGRDSALSEMQGAACARGAAMLAANPKGMKDKFMQDIFAWYYTGRAEWQPHVALPSIEFAKYSHGTRFNEFYNELWNMVTFEDVYNLAIALFDADPDSDSEEEKRASAAAAEAEEEMKEGKGDGEKGEGGEAEGGEEGDGEGGHVKYEDIMSHKHSGEVGESGDYGTTEYDDHSYHSYVPYQEDEIVRKKARDLRLPPARICELNNMKAMAEKGSKLGMKVKRLFQSQSQSRIERNLKAGRLDRKALHRIAGGAVDVYSKKVNRISCENTVLYLLVDASGSMTGDRFNCAAAAGALMTEAMLPLKVPVKISAFTERTAWLGWEHKEQLEDYVIKDYAEHRPRVKILEDFNKVVPKLYQNADGDSLMLAYRDIMARKEKRKILVVLSDGEPCSDRGGSADKYLKQVVEYVETSPVEVYAIGIESRSVSRFYKNYQVLSSTSELEPCLLNLVKSKFI